MKTTLNDIKKNESGCTYIAKLLHHLGKSEPDDEPLDLLTVLDVLGPRAVLWCMGWGADSKTNISLGVLLASEVHHLMPEKSKEALKSARLFTQNLGTWEQMQDASNAAFEESNDNLCAAGYAADAAASGLLVHCFEEAAKAAGEEARDAAFVAARKKQAKIIRKFISEM